MLGKFIREITEKGNGLEDLFEQIHIPNKTVLLNEGEISKNIFFVRAGALRLWTNNNKGDDITVQFFFEGQGVSSFLGREPSLFCIESIEPSTIIKLRLEDMETILEKMPQYKDSLFEFILYRARHYGQLFISRIKYSPEERYMELLKNNPEIVRRIPQHYIATYLGVTPVSLSRIRNRIR